MRQSMFSLSINNFHQSQDSVNSIIKSTAKVGAIVGSVMAVASAILFASNSGLISVGIGATLPPILPIALCAIGVSIALTSILFLLTKKQSSQNKLKPEVQTAISTPQTNPKQEVQATPPTPQTDSTQDVQTTTPTPQPVSKPEIQFKPYVRYPLLETTCGTYDLKKFATFPENDSIYNGGNRVEIPNSEGGILLLPRTLYHMLFIYFCFESNMDYQQFPPLGRPTRLDSKEELNPASWIDCDLTKQPIEKSTYNKRAFELAQHNLNTKILTFFKDKKINELTWRECRFLIYELADKFEAMRKKKGHHDLWEHFYDNCFNAKVDDRTGYFDEMVYNAIAVEWMASPNSEVFYRTSNLSKDNIITADDSPQSLSFGSSLFSGIVFEGYEGGTCPYVYYISSLKDTRKQLYALELSSSKINKYFFRPPFKDLELLSLTAEGEFSHPRLKFFRNPKEVQGVILADGFARQVAQFNPTDKIPDQKSYEAKIMKIFQKSIRIIKMGRD